MKTRTKFRQLYPSGTRTLYVAGTGVDTNSGLTSALPKRTIQAAINMAVAGDRIIVGEGTYSYSFFWQKAGTASAWITIENAPGTLPVIDVSNTSNNGLDIQISSYVAIYGLEVRALQTQTQTNPSGIGIFRGSHHVAIWCCHVHDFPGGGINCFYVAADVGNGYPAGGWDAVDVFFNRVNGTSKYSVYNTSGISFYGAVNMTGLLSGGYGYRAVGNYIFDVICTVPYTPGGFTDVTDGNGISPDSLAVPNSLNPSLAAYLKRGLIEGNVVTKCGGPGVKFYNTKNADVICNTLIGNLLTDSPYMAGYKEVQISNGSDPDHGVTVEGNIALTGTLPFSGNLILGDSAEPPKSWSSWWDANVWFTSNPTQAVTLTTQAQRAAAV